MMNSIKDKEHIFFIGVAGSGMSAIAQYLAGNGKKVSGSDRYFEPGVFNDTRSKLEAADITCFPQNGEGITSATELVVISTAVEETVAELVKARQLNIPVIKRAALLALIAKSKRTIAVGGTSGKSTTSAMLFAILEYANLQPSIISGAGLASIMKEGKIGNAKVGEGEWLVIEADESDGSIILYETEIGLLLNVDKDHQEIEELMQIFKAFREHTRKTFIVNRSNILSGRFSQNIAVDFSVDEHSGAGFIASHFEQDGLSIRFVINGTAFLLHTLGKHNMENALAAVAVAVQLGVNLSQCSAALANYTGIYRRHQVLGEKKGVWVIDDYAHNPVKCAASIAACQQVAPKVIAWFQPHGYGPTKFLRNDFVHEFSAVLRPEDELWMSEIFYAGGTAVKDISAADLVNDLQLLGVNAFFINDRKDLLDAVRPHLSGNCVLLLMGARDPGLEQFGRSVFQQL